MSVNEESHPSGWLLYMQTRASIKLWCRFCRSHFGDKKPLHKQRFLLAEDEGFEFAEESPLVAKRPHLVSLSSDQFSKCTVCTIWNVV